jgi:membrane associated rhomboid family serine protease
MVTVEVPAEAGRPLTLDVCKRCEVVWFDTTEFGTVPAADKTPSDEMSPASREALARMEIEKMAEKAEKEDEQSPQGWQWLPAILGMPVEVDAPLLSRLPVVTIGLTAVATILYIVLALTGTVDKVGDNWGFIPDEWSRRLGLTVITAFFLHASIFHLVSNMYFFVVFGDNVEDHLGKARFLLLLLASQVAGQVVHAAFDPRGDIPCVGASAAIAGVLAYYAVLFPLARIGLFVRFFWLKMPALVMVGLFILLQVLGAFKQVRGLESVSYLAHLGGLGVGLIAGIASRVSDSWQKRSDAAETAAE